MSALIKSRIAPTPSGFLHKGNLFNFWLTQYLVNQHKGTLLLRIDDLDAQRANQTYLENIFTMLHKAGIIWQEGAKSAEEHLQHFSQQLRITEYDKLLQQLVEKNLVYACTCSRKNLEEKPCECRNNNNLLLDNLNAAWRVKTDKNNVVTFNDKIQGKVTIDINKTMRDFVVKRKDGIAAYQIASLSDDINYNINLIVRGIDLIESTAAQLWLAQQLNLKPFLETIFYHHPLITDVNGNKLSKSAGNANNELNIVELRKEFYNWGLGFCYAKT